METQRTIKLVLMELAVDNLKLEDQLERTINSDSEINNKTERIKTILAQIVAVEASITKFTSLITPKNNNDLTPQNNGN